MCGILTGSGVDFVLVQQAVAELIPRSRLHSQVAGTKAACFVYCLVHVTCHSRVSRRDGL